MKKTDSAALIRSQIAGGTKEAGTLLLALTAMGHSAKFDGSRNDDVDTLAKREEVRRIVREDPALAFAIVALPRERTGLTLRGAADVFDAIVGEIEDPLEAREHINAKITPERQVELLRARGDLPSSAADVADPAVVLGTIFEDLSWEGDEFDRVFWLQAWAHKLKDRDDWKDILEMPIGLYTVRHLLCLAVAIEARGQLELAWEIEDIEPDLFDNVGLEPAEAQDLLREMDIKTAFPEIDRYELERIHRAMGEQTAAAKSAPQTTSEAAAAAAAAVAEADEFKL